MKFTTPRKKQGITWHDLCKVIKSATDAGDNEVQGATIHATVTVRNGTVQSLTIDTGDDE